MKIKNLKKYFNVIFTILMTIPYIKGAKLDNNNNNKEPLTSFDINQYIGFPANESPSKFATKSMEDFLTITTNEINREIISQPNYRETKNIEIEKANMFLGEYIKTTYNSDGYATYISQNGEELINLIKILNRFDLGESKRSYAYTTIRLFNEKLKEPGAEIVDSTMVSKLLKELPLVIKPYFEDNINLDNSLGMIKRSLHKSIIDVSRGEEFNENKDTFIQNFMREVSISVANLLDIQEEKIRLQQLIVRLIENVFEKMYWSRTRYETFLPSLTQISNRVLLLVKNGIIKDADDFDSLMKSLICASCRYLDIFSWAFPIEFFEEIEDSLENNQITFLKDREQDDLIKTKEQLFTSMFIKCKTRAMAYHKLGILPNY